LCASVDEALESYCGKRRINKRTASIAGGAWSGTRLIFLAMAEDQFWVGVHGVIAEEGRILVLKRAPAMSYKPGTWDLPGGHLAIGELFEECLAREIAEETGLSVAIERLLGIHNSVGPYLQALFACSVVGTRGEIRLRAHEHVDARWVAPHEFGQLELIPYLEGILRRGMLDFVDRRR
jgi:8-oxo-dGTP diphosphatase